MVYLQIGRFIVRGFDGMRAYQQAASWKYHLGMFGINATVQMYRPTSNAIRLFP